MSCFWGMVWNILPYYSVPLRFSQCCSLNVPPAEPVVYRQWNMQQTLFTEDCARRTGTQPGISDWGKGLKIPHNFSPQLKCKTTEAGEGSHYTRTLSSNLWKVHRPLVVAGGGSGPLHPPGQRRPWTVICKFVLTCICRLALLIAYFYQWYCFQAR